MVEIGRGRDNVKRIKESPYTESRVKSPNNRRAVRYDAWLWMKQGACGNIDVCTFASVF